jgi:hypothetical protein
MMCETRQNGAAVATLNATADGNAHTGHITHERVDGDDAPARRHDIPQHC